MKLLALLVFVLPALIIPAFIHQPEMMRRTIYLVYFFCGPVAAVMVSLGKKRNVVFYLGLAAVLPRFVCASKPTASGEILFAGLLREHCSDASSWHGLDLCRHEKQVASNPSPLRPKAFVRSLLRFPLPSKLVGNQV